MSAAPQLLSSNRPQFRQAILTIQSGSRAGTIFLLKGSEVTIGRASENNISLPDDLKCSRKHAALRLTPQGVFIRSLSDKNPVIINQKPCITEEQLQEHTKILVGSTELIFETREVNTGPAAPRRPKIQKPSFSLSPRFAIYAVVALAFAWLMWPTDNKKKVSTLRTQEQIEADIEEAEQMKSAAQKEMGKQKDNSISYQQAQETYIKGFRDYRKGQYERALEQFQACLSLYPQHGLCSRYLRLSQRKFNEIIQQQMILGRKYRDQNQFKACLSSYRNVMVMIKDSQNVTYKEAKTNYDYCHYMIEGRY